MAIPGYDIEDIEDDLHERLEGDLLEEFLDEEEQRRLDRGESLIDLLDGDDLKRLLDRSDAVERSE